MFERDAIAVGEDLAGPVNVEPGWRRGAEIIVGEFGGSWESGS